MIQDLRAIVKSPVKKNLLILIITTASVYLMFATQWYRILDAYEGGKYFEQCMEVFTYIVFIASASYSISQRFDFETGYNYYIIWAPSMVGLLPTILCIYYYEALYSGITIFTGILILIGWFADIVKNENKVSNPAQNNLYMPPQNTWPTVDQMIVNNQNYNQQTIMQQPTQPQIIVQQPAQRQIIVQQPAQQQVFVQQPFVQAQPQLQPVLVQQVQPQPQVQVLQQPQVKEQVKPTV